MYLKWTFSGATRLSAVKSIHTSRTLAVCELLLADRDDMVVKALSWALRSLSVRDRQPVEAFVAQHGAGVAARVRREVANKLRTGRKTPKAGSG